MDEMTVVREYAADTPLPSAAGLASVRGKLMAEIAPPRKRRFRVAGWSTIGVAAAAATVLVATSLGGGDSPAPQGSPQASPVPQVVNAAQVLHLAADAARQAPYVTPRPDQFVYSRTEGRGFHEDLWLSVDGTRDGRSNDVVVHGCRDGRIVVVEADGSNPAQTEPCKPDPAYLPDLPADVGGMVDYLSNGQPELNSMAKNALTLLQQHYLPGKSRATVFEALTRIPGLIVDKDAQAPNGRRGIGIAWDHNGARAEMVFDVKTHMYLGTTDSALTALKIVDKVGQR